MNDRYREWKQRFERAESAWLLCDSQTAMASYADALEIASTGCVSAAELADTLEGLASSRLQFGSDAEVEDLFERAVAARQKILDAAMAKFGERDRCTAEAYRRLALLSVRRRRPAEAIVYLNKELAVLRACFGSYHIEVANALCGVAGMLNRSGMNSNPEVKTRLWEEAASILERFIDRPADLDPKYRDSVPRLLHSVWEHLAIDAYNNSLFERSEAYFRRAMSSRIRRSSVASFAVCDPSMFARVLIAQRKFTEAEDFLLCEGESDSELVRRSCDEVLAELYDQTGRPLAAQRIRETLPRGIEIS